MPKKAAPEWKSQHLNPHPFSSEPLSTQCHGMLWAIWSRGGGFTSRMRSAAKRCDLIATKSPLFLLKTVTNVPLAHPNHPVQNGKHVSFPTIICSLFSSFWPTVSLSMISIQDLRLVLDPSFSHVTCHVYLLARSAGFCIRYNAITQPLVPTPLTPACWDHGSGLQWLPDCRSFPISMPVPLLLPRPVHPSHFASLQEATWTLVQFILEARALPF